MRRSIVAWNHGRTAHGFHFSSQYVGSDRCRRSSNDVGLAHAQTADGAIPQPQRPGHGGTDPGPRNLMRDQQNPDMLVPPSTDHGSLPNLRFSFSDAHMRLEPGGWTRQVTQRELGIATSLGRREYAPERRRRA